MCYVSYGIFFIDEDPAGLLDPEPSDIVRRCGMQILLKYTVAFALADKSRGSDYRNGELFIIVRVDI